MIKLIFANRDDPLLVQNGPYKPFTLSHIIVILILFQLVCLAVRQSRHKEYRIRYKRVCKAYKFLVFLNILRFVWDWHTGCFNIKEDLPLQLCGIQMFAIPLALYTQRIKSDPISRPAFPKFNAISKKIHKIGIYAIEFVYAYGIIGFLLALIFPATTLYDYPVFHLRSIQSFLYHTTMGFIAFMLPHLNYRPRVYNIRKAYNSLILCTLFTGIVNISIGSNYLYTAKLPIRFDLLPWPTYLPFLFAFALGVGYLPYYIYDLVQEKYSDKDKETHSQAWDSPRF
ncbi:MAG: YwaF family protein [Clostridiales bacterium]|nr:YwaF family protein [Clostridiales bacterium]